MKKGQSGFTIIEIMLVVAIIGILAVVAIRSVAGYAVRAKVSEALLAFTNCRTVISEVYASADVFPGPNNWGCESVTTSNFVDTITTTNEGIILVGLRGFGDLRIDFHTISLAPLDSSGALMTDVGPVARWRCGAPGDGTDVSAEFLPATCRG
jgi:type IV pilus assembly protein PilA